MIDIKNITKSFGSLQVLKGIDLHIDKGEVVSIVGPSGAGKTTLLQIIGTLDRPDSGQVIVDGIDTCDLSTKKLSDFRNKHLGFVFQFHQLLPEFTAIENIMIPAYIAGTSPKKAKQRALAGAAGAHDAHHLAAVDVKVDALQHLQRAEALGDVLYIYHNICQKSEVKKF